MPFDFVPHPSRRSFLAFGAATFASASIPKFASASTGRDPRLIVVILRGALDGLSAVGPVGDPDYVGLHGDIALSFSGDHAAIKLNDFFGLNPAMTNFARLTIPSKPCWSTPSPRTTATARTSMGRMCWRAAC